jgi:hypothetical protein
MKVTLADTLSSALFPLLGIHIALASWHARKNQYTNPQNENNLIKENTNIFLVL